MASSSHDTGDHADQPGMLNPMDEGEPPRKKQKLDNTPTEQHSDSTTGASTAAPLPMPPSTVKPEHSDSAAGASTEGAETVRLQASTIDVDSAVSAASTSWTPIPINSSTITLVYFGTEVLVCTLTPNVRESLILDLRDLLHIDNVEKFKAAIEEDCTRLRDISDRTWETTFRFIKVRDVAKVYFYTFRHKNTTFSKTKLSSLLPHIIFNEQYLPRDQLQICTHGDHYELDAFFQSSQSLLDLYESEMESATDPSKKARLRSLIEAEEAVESPLSITDYKEADWTKRLFQAIQIAYPDLSPILTMDKALTFSCNGGLAQQWSSCVNSSKHLYFHGAPDLVLNGKMVVIGSNEEEEDADTSTSSCDTDTLLEVANQRPPMATAEGCKLSPEKLGELLAAMVTRGACKIMKHIRVKQSIKNRYTVRGLLLDKMSGAFHCKLEIFPVHITDASKCEYMKVTVQAAHGLLIAENLCKHIHFNM